MNTATSRYSTAWDEPKMMNSVKQHYIIYSYSVHKKNLDSIKVDPNLKMVDNAEPLTYKLFPPANSIQQSTVFQSGKQNSKQYPAPVSKTKAEREKDLVVDMENGSLINRMMQISEKGTQYNKNLIDKQLFKCEKSLNAPLRRKESHLVNTENLSLHNRLEKVQSTIRFDKYEKSYGNSKRYKSNITRSSRRIFNCFIKTDQNHELLATTTSAYERLTKPMTSTSKQSNKINLESRQGKRQKVKNNNEQNQEQQENLQESQFNENKEQSKQQKQPQEEQVEHLKEENKPLNQKKKEEDSKEQEEEEKPVNLSQNQALDIVQNKKERQIQNQEQAQQSHQVKKDESKEKQESNNDEDQDEIRNDDEEGGEGEEEEQERQ